MKALTVIWNWFNGNKTQLGALIIAIVASGFIPEHTFGYTVLAWLGPVLAGLGVGHKIVKGVNNT